MTPKNSNTRREMPLLLEIGRATDILQRQPDGANKDRGSYQRVQAATSSKKKRPKTDPSATKDEKTKAPK